MAMSGEHGQRRGRKRGVPILTLPQAQELRTRLESQKRVRISDVREVVGAVSDPHDERRLLNVVKTANRRCATAVPRFLGACRVEHLRSEVSLWQKRQSTTLEEAGVDDLWIFGDPVINSERVCICFSSRGMATKLRGAGTKGLFLAIDSKESIIARDYGVTTVAFLTRSAIPRSTTIGRPCGKSVKSEHYTGHAEPFLQAIVSSEKADNMEAVLSAACALAESHCGVDLKRRVFQVHSDFSHGIASARRRVFPGARPCTDFSHLMLSARAKLQKHLRVSKPSTVRSEKPGAKVRKCWAKVHLERCMDLFRKTRFLGSAQLFDAVWQVHLRAVAQGLGETQAAQYMEQTYFSKTTASNLQKRARVGNPAWGAEHFWFSGFWSGCLGTATGQQ